MAVRDSKLAIVVELVDKASKRLDNVSDSIAKSQARAKEARKASFAFAGGLAAVGTAAGMLGKKMVVAADRYERTQIAFETMTGSAEKAKKMLSDLAEFAKRTPFDIQGVRENAQRLIGMGIQAENVLPALKMLGDVSAGTGAELSRLALNFGQVQAKGKLTGRELRDFATAGVRLTDVLAGITDKTEAQVMEMVSAGKVTYPMVVRAFEAMTTEGGKYNDLMFRMSDTVTGTVNALRESWTLFLEQEGRALLDWTKKVIEGLTHLVDNVLPKFIKFVKKATKWLAKHKTVLVIVAGAIMGALLPAIAAVTGAVLGLITALAPFMIGGAIVAGVVYGLVKMATALSRIDEDIQKFMDGLGEAKSAVGGWGNFFKLVLNEIQRTVALWAAAVLEKFTAIVRKAYEIHQYFGDILPGDGETLRRAMTGLTTTTLELRRGAELLNEEGDRMAKTFVEEAKRAKETGEEADALAGGMENLENIFNKVGGEGEKAMKRLEDSVKRVRDEFINTLRDIQDQFLGMRDKEIGALQDVIRYNKEKMEIIQRGWGKVGEAIPRPRFEEYERYAKEVEKAERRIEKLKMGRPVTPTTQVMEWAGETKRFLREKIKKVGVGMPTETYPRLQPVAATPERAVKNFNFNFEGAFIGDPDAFKQEIMNLINRKSELGELQGE